MVTRTLLYAIVTGLILAGCQSMPWRTGTGTHSVCRTSTCQINVSVRDRQVSVDVDVLEIPRGNQNVQIFWTLPAGYSFITPMGDGVFFNLDDRGQFDEGFATDEEGGRPRRAARKFRWRDLNTVPGPHTYRIMFHDSAGNFHTLDPTIMNGR